MKRYKEFKVCRRCLKKFEAAHTLRRYCDECKEGG